LFKNVIFVLSFFILFNNSALAINVIVKDFSTKEVKNFETTNDFKIPAVSNINQCSIKNETRDDTKTLKNESTWIIVCTVRDIKTQTYTPAPVIQLSCSHSNNVINFQIMESIESKEDALTVSPRYNVFVSCEKA